MIKLDTCSITNSTDNETSVNIEQLRSGWIDTTKPYKPEYYNLSSSVPVPLKADDATFIEHPSDESTTYQIDCNLYDPMLRS